MDIEKIGQLVTAIMSAIAILISIIKGNKRHYTLEEIEDKEELRKQKRIAKAIKKEKLKVDTNTKSQNCQDVAENIKSSNEEIKQVDNIIYRG